MFAKLFRPQHALRPSTQSSVCWRASLTTAEKQGRQVRHLPEIGRISSLLQCSHHCAGICQAKVKRCGMSRQWPGVSGEVTPQHAELRLYGAAAFERCLQVRPGPEHQAHAVLVFAGSSGRALGRLLPGNPFV